MIVHVLNRGNARDPIFNDVADDAAFEKLLLETQADVFLRIQSGRLVPSPWHPVTTTGRTEP